MKVIYGIGNLSKGPKTSKVIAVGVFDGVHRGHRMILRRVVRQAKKRKAHAAVLTFPFHPACAFMPSQKVPHLTSLEQKLALIEKEGIDCCYVLDFNKAFAAIPAEHFVKDILGKKLKIVALYIGEDFIFGKGARGDKDLLEKLSGRYHFDLHVLKRLRLKRRIVSSTLVRQLVKRGRLEEARYLLGRPVSIFGRVVRGEGRGKKLGFPTANIRPDHDVLVPDGIYAAEAVLNNRKFKSAVYIGAKPTFHKKPNNRSIEVFLLGVRKNLYGQKMEVRFVKKVRSDRPFSSPRALVAQIKKDVIAAQKALKNFSLQAP